MNRTIFSVMRIVGLAFASQCLSGCFPALSDQSPATVEFPTFTVEVPRGRSDISELSAGDNSLVVEFCNLQLGPEALADGCEKRDPALEDIRGFRTILSKPFTDLTKFQNRPVLAAPPRQIPLVRYGDAPEPNTQSDSEWFQFSRLRSFAEDKGPIMTTAVGWPLVHCDPRGADVAWCTLGFQIDGAFVETSWSHLGPLTQAELWRIGSGLDAKIRQCIRPSIC